MGVIENESYYYNCSHAIFSRLSDIIPKIKSLIFMVKCRRTLRLLINKLKREKMIVVIPPIYQPG